MIGLDIGVNDDQDGGARDGSAVWFGDANDFTSSAQFGALTLSP